MTQKIVEDFINELAAENGGNVTPDLVLTVASDPSCPVHDQFDWDNETAGAKWRLQQARKMISSVQVVVETEEILFRAPAYIRDPEAGKQQGYTSTVGIKTDRQRAIQALEIELKRAVSVMTRARDVGRALGIETEFEEMLERLEMLRDNL